MSNIVGMRSVNRCRGPHRQVAEARKEDRVDAGEPVVELETEKIDLEATRKGGGHQAASRKEGEDVKIGEVLAVMDECARGLAAAGTNGQSQKPGGRKAEAKSEARATDRPGGAPDREEGEHGARRTREIIPRTSQGRSATPAA